MGSLNGKRVGSDARECLVEMDKSEFGAVDVFCAVLPLLA
jgi:hypothetical protein